MSEPGFVSIPPENINTITDMKNNNEQKNIHT